MDGLNECLKKAIDSGIIPGMCYGIISQDEVYTGHVGNMAIFPSEESTDMDTLYDIASLTKVLVTVPIICKLIESGKLSFNSTVKTFLPNFKYDDITIYHLLTHTSGLPSDLKDFKLTDPKSVYDMIFNIEKENEPGKKVVYSDIGFIFLGFIIEKIYNKSLDAVAEEEVFLPLEMFDTHYKPRFKRYCAPTEITEKRGVVRGFVHDEKCFSLNGIAGHAGVFLNVKDMLKFIQMILNKGVFNDQMFLSEEMINLWFKNLVYEVDNDRTRSLCFITGNNDLVIKGKENVISFSGFTGPSISIDFVNKIGIVMLTNRVHPSRSNNMISRERSKFTDYIYKILEDKKRKRK